MSCAQDAGPTDHDHCLSHNIIKTEKEDDIQLPDYEEVDDLE